MAPPKSEIQGAGQAVEQAQVVEVAGDGASDPALAEEPLVQEWLIAVGDATPDSGVGTETVTQMSQWGEPTTTVGVNAEILVPGMTPGKPLSEATPPSEPAVPVLDYVEQPDKVGILNPAEVTNATRAPTFEAGTPTADPGVPKVETVAQPAQASTVNAETGAPQPSADQDSKRFITDWKGNKLEVVYDSRWRSDPTKIAPDGKRLLSPDMLGPNESAVGKVEQLLTPDVLDRVEGMMKTREQTVVELNSAIEHLVNGPNKDEAYADALRQLVSRVESGTMTGADAQSVQKQLFAQRGRVEGDLARADMEMGRLRMEQDRARIAATDGAVGKSEAEIMQLDQEFAKAQAAVSAQVEKMKALQGRIDGLGPLAGEASQLLVLQEADPAVLAAVENRKSAETGGTTVESGIKVGVDEATGLEKHKFGDIEFEFKPLTEMDLPELKVELQETDEFLAKLNEKVPKIAEMKVNIAANTARVEVFGEVVASLNAEFANLPEGSPAVLVLEQLITQYSQQVENMKLQNEEQTEQVVAFEALMVAVLAYKKSLEQAIQVKEDTAGALSEAPSIDGWNYLDQFFHDSPGLTDRLRKKVAGRIINKRKGLFASILATIFKETN